MENPTGNSSAPMIGWPVLTLMVTANYAASARIALVMLVRMIVSRVDMNILDSPASTILVTNSEGTRYDITASFFREEFEAPHSGSAIDMPAPGADRNGRKIGVLRGCQRRTAANLCNCTCASQWMGS